MARGDHIYVYRLGGAYSHHGIDCGDGSVIHYSGENWYEPRRVRHTPMERFTMGGEIQVRDYARMVQSLKHPEKLPQRLRVALARLAGQRVDVAGFTTESVISRAESRLGEAAFSIVFHNCEHFATWCKTGMSDSAQINALWRASLGPVEYWRMRGERAVAWFAEADWNPLRDRG